MKSPFPARYFLASIALLLVLVLLYAASAALRTQRALSRQLEEKGLALAEAIEISSRKAVQSNALMEEMIARRLLDNARLIDRLLLSRPYDPTLLKRVSAMNGLQRVDLLDREGRPFALPRTPRGMMDMMRGVPGPEGAGEGHRRMMMYMWGRQWDLPGEEALPAPPAVKNRKFWEGSVFGVAVEAQSFPGIIAVHADADFVLNFRKEIGVERQIQDLGRQPGVMEIALVGSDLTVIAHSDPGRIGERKSDDLLNRAMTEQKPLSRLVQNPGDGEGFEVVRPLHLGGSRLGLITVILSTAPMEHAWRRDLGSGAVMGLAVLLTGVMGMGIIFYIQQRHLREVKALEAEVDRRERLSALGNLAAVVGHEVRNPLNAIGMGLQRLRGEFRPVENEAEFTRFVDLMQGEVARLDGIVEDFLSLARPVTLKRETVRIDTLLRDVAALVVADAEGRGVRVGLDIPADLPPVQLDKGQMRQVILNLVLNGLDAMPGGGALTIAASETQQVLVLTVGDTGEGVPPDLLPRIFEPYMTTKAKGMGLGLTIARRIVEAHGGRIEVESRPRDGTRFTIRLPVRSQPVSVEVTQDG